jgi:hypothetical protein
MFDSGISVNNLIEELNTEVDIALDIPNATYVTWLNALQQLLYSEVIKEQKKTTIVGVIPNPVELSYICDESIENRPRFEDIHAIFADGVQLIKSTVTSGAVFPNNFYKENNNIGYNIKPAPSSMTIVYFTKPKLVEVDDNDNIIDANIMVPIEFIDLVKAKLRGEAYKLANEDGIAAKWLNDYNMLLETFKAWISEKSSNFGL